MISRLSSGPPGRRHSLFAAPDPQMGTRSHVELPAVVDKEEEEEEKKGECRVQVVISPDVEEGEEEEKISAADTDRVVTSSASEDEDETIVTLNVGGRIFQTYRRTLTRVTHTRLALLARCTPKGREIFFDRNPDMFEAILSFYRDDVLHAPRHVCVISFCKELEFWGLNETWLSECCQKVYNDAVGERQMAEMMKMEFAKIRPRRAISSSDFIKTRRGKLWEFLDNPQSSMFAKIWFLCFYIFLMISVANVFISTHPGCRVPINNTHLDHEHSETLDDFLMSQAENNPKIRRLLTTRPHEAVIVLEVLCAIYFTVEFTLRVVVCPHKRLLFRSPLTWVDLLYIVPLWCELFSSSAHVEFWNNPDMLPGALFLKIVMVLRVLRIFTLAKHYRALRILLLSIRASLKEILLLFTFVIFTMIIYASFVYCAEIFTADSQFDTLVTGLWWALITMTTVGYGDVVPKSWLGYIVGSACAITGIIIIGMPVPIITSNFHLYYGFQPPADEEEENVIKSNAVQNKSVKSPIRQGNG